MSDFDPAWRPGRYEDNVPLSKDVVNRFIRRVYFTIVIVPTGAAHVVRALEFAAVGAFRRVARGQRVMCAAHVPARFRDLILGDSHVSTSGGRAAARSERQGDMPLEA